MNTKTFVVLGLGSNRFFKEFSPLQVLSHGVSRISGFLENMKVSSVYRTQAMYLENQADFYNMTVSGFFTGSPSELLEKIHNVENEWGRDRTTELRNGPRSLDVDIEIFGKEKINEADLIIPHEKMKERAFVLIPMLEILDKSADKLINGLSELRETAQTEKIQGQRIELYMKSSDFLMALNEKGGFYGTDRINGSH